MLKRCAQLLSRLPVGRSLAGQGLPERIRTATVGLLGVTAAVSMAFVAVIAHQGWTVLSLGPIPAPFVGAQEVGDGTALSTGEGGGAAPTGGQPAVVATAKLTAGSQGAQPGRAPAQPPGGSLAESQPLAQQGQGAEAPGASPGGGGGGAPGAPPEQPSSQPGSPATPPSGGGEKGTAGVGGQEEGGEEVEESPTAQPVPVETPPPEEVEEPEEESPGSWWEEHGHGHGYGHHHW